MMRCNAMRVESEWEFSERMMEDNQCVDMSECTRCFIRRCARKTLRLNERQTVCQCRWKTSLHVGAYSSLLATGSDMGGIAMGAGVHCSRYSSCSRDSSFSFPLSFLLRLKTPDHPCFSLSQNGSSLKTVASES